MPRTWSYRKRDYDLVKPQHKGLPAAVVGYIVLFGIISVGVAIGMTFALTHPMKTGDPTGMTVNSAGPGGTFIELKDN